VAGRNQDYTYTKPPPDSVHAGFSIRFRKGVILEALAESLGFELVLLTTKPIALLHVIDLALQVFGQRGFHSLKLFILSTGRLFSIVT